jgi:outer membrane protein OmpA-like peptidoglycan-associated protein
MPPMPGPFPLYFDFDSAKVTAEGQKVVASAAAAIAAVKPAAVIVTGHTDRTGPDAYNMALSKRRAEAVALALILAGVTTDIGIFVASYGENELLVPTDDERRESRNRRAVIALKPFSVQPQLGAESR